MDFTIGGIPLHPLIVHLSVVAAPVAALLAIIWALGKRNLALATVITSVVGAAATIVAKITGERLLEAMGFSEHQPGPAADHANWATFAVISVCVLAGVSVVAWWAQRKPMATLWNITRVLLVIAAVATIVTMVLTGHEGALLVWQDQELPAP